MSEQANNFNKFFDNIKKSFDKDKKKKKDQKEEGVIDEINEELKEIKEDIKEEIKEVIDEFKEELEEFKKENPFLSRSNEETSLAEKEILKVMDDVLKTGDSQEIDLKDNSSLMIEQNEAGNIDIFHSSNVEEPLTSFDDNFNPTNEKGWGQIKGMMNNFIKSHQLEEQGIDKIIKDASKETENEINAQDPKNQALSQIMNTLDAFLNPEQQKR